MCNQLKIFLLILTVAAFSKYVKCSYSLIGDCICLDRNTTGFGIKQGYSTVMGGLERQMQKAIGIQESIQQMPVEICPCPTVSVMSVPVMADIGMNMASGAIASEGEEKYIAAPAQAQYVAAPTQAQYVAAPAQAQYVAAPAQAQYVAAPAQAQYVAAPAQAQYVAAGQQAAQAQYVAAGQQAAQAQYVAVAPAQTVQKIVAIPQASQQMVSSVAAAAPVSAAQQYVSAQIVNVPTISMQEAAEQASMQAAHATQLQKLKKSGMLLQAAEVASMNSAQQVDKIVKAAQAITELGVKEAMHAKQMATMAAMAQVEHQENTQAAMKNYEAMKKARSNIQTVSQVAIPMAVRPTSVLSRPAIIQRAPAIQKVLAANSVKIAPVTAGSIIGGGAIGGGSIIGGDAAVCTTDTGLNIASGMRMEVQQAPMPQVTMNTTPMVFGIVSNGEGVSGRQCICPPIYENQRAGMAAVDAGESSAGMVNGFGAKLAASLARKIISEAAIGEMDSTKLGEGRMDLDTMLCLNKIKEAQRSASIQQQIASGNLSMCLDIVGKSNILDSMLASNIVCYC